MNMTEETMNDALDDILAESGDEEEEEGIVNQVLDEIGIEISGKVRILKVHGDKFPWLELSNYCCLTSN